MSSRSRNKTRSKSSKSKLTSLYRNQLQNIDSMDQEKLLKVYDNLLIDKEHLENKVFNMAENAENPDYALLENLSNKYNIVLEYLDTIDNEIKRRFNNRIKQFTRKANQRKVLIETGSNAVSRYLPKLNTRSTRKAQTPFSMFTLSRRSPRNDLPLQGTLTPNSYLLKKNKFYKPRQFDQSSSL